MVMLHYWFSRGKIANTELGRVSPVSRKEEANVELLEAERWWKTLEVK